MKKVGVIIFTCALVLGLVAANIFSFGRVKDRFLNFSFNFGSAQGSGNTASEVRRVSGFKAVDVGGVFQVEIVAQQEHAVEVEADDNLLQFIRTDVRNGVLNIETSRRLKTSNPLRIRVAAPDIEELDVSGAASVAVSNLKNPGLKVDSSGASKIKVAGETSKLVIDVSGATKVDGQNLVAENVSVEASGASSVQVNVAGNLRARTSGASSVIYSGNPKEVVKKTSGASSVSPR
jgi:hypothetical protein